MHVKLKSPNITLPALGEVDLNSPAEEVLEGLDSSLFKLRQDQFRVVLEEAFDGCDSLITLQHINEVFHVGLQPQADLV